MLRLWFWDLDFRHLGIVLLFIYILYYIIFLILFVLARGGQVVHTPTLFKKLKGQTLEEVYRFERSTPKKLFFIIVKGLLKIIVYLHFVSWGGEGGRGVLCKNNY
jgi:hypothetical protein